MDSPGLALPVENSGFYKAGLRPGWRTNTTNSVNNRVDILEDLVSDLDRVNVRNDHHFGPDAVVNIDRRPTKSTKRKARARCYWF